MNYATKKNTAPSLRLKLEGSRSRVALVGCLALFLVLLGRAFYLQGMNNDFLQAKGESRFVRVVDMPASRGAVMDRNGKPLAISTPVESIWASPSDMALTEPQVVKLAAALGLDKNLLAEKLQDKEKNFVWLRRQLSPELAARVVALKIPGVFQQREFRRFYPAGDVAAHVIGFTGIPAAVTVGTDRCQGIGGSPDPERTDLVSRIVGGIPALHPAVGLAVREPDPAASVVGKAIGPAGF